MDLDKLLGDGSPDLDDISPEDALKMMVGETGKYKTPEELAKSALHRERHVARLELELADARKDIQGKATIEDILAKLSKTDAPPKQISDPGDNQGKGLEGQADIAKIVAEALAKRDAESQRQTEEQAKANNLKMFVDELKKGWGPGFKNELDKKAKEMGVSVETLVQFAQTNPSVIIKALGVEVKADPNSALPPRSNFSSKGNVPVGTSRNDSFYKALKKSDPNKYWSPAIQKQRLDDATRLGQDFFK